MSTYGAFSPGPASFTVIVNRRAEPNGRQKVLAVAPLMLLGLLAAACLISTAEWNGNAEQTSLSAIGASEEGEAEKAIAVAKSIGKDEVTAKNPDVDPKILEEVKKAEAEMKHETVTEMEYASGKDSVSDDSGEAKEVRSDADAGFDALKTAQLSARKRRA